NRQAPAIPAKPESEWMPKFREVYALKQGEVLKRVPKPFIPQRIEFYRAKMHPSQVQAMPRVPDFYLLNDNGEEFSMITAWFGQPDVAGLFASVLNIDSTTLIGDQKLLNQQLTGDIVLSPTASVE